VVHVRLVLLSGAALLAACGRPPGEARSVLLSSLSLAQPAGAGRSCTRWTATRAPGQVDHWECNRVMERETAADSGPWSEDRVSVSRDGRVQWGQRSWAVPDTLRWLALADSIGGALRHRGALEVRCLESFAGISGVRNWYLDSAFVTLQAFPFAVRAPAGRPPIPVHFELQLRARPRGGQTCIPVLARPNPLMQPTNAGTAGRRQRPTLPATTKDHRFSQVVCS
jgi:hypothetical protein